jgi:hypothetical protein
VRFRSCVWLWLVIFGAMCSAVQRGAEGPPPGEQFLGTWTGTWDGGGGAGGGFELTLEKDKNGAIGGMVSVTGEPTYKATLKSVSFEGKKMIAKYDFPPDEGGQVIIAASFDDKTATGTWSLRDKSSDNEVSSGGWTATRK